jgi:DNA-binding PadR family transcriptional regulator
MSAPQISHLQAAALDAISQPIRGRELRKKLASKGFKQSSPAFYRLMSRLEEMNLIKVSGR